MCGGRASSLKSLLQRLRVPNGALVGDGTLASTTSTSFSALNLAVRKSGEIDPNLDPQPTEETDMLIKITASGQTMKGSF